VKATPRAFPRAVVFTTRCEVAREGEPTLRQAWWLLPYHYGWHHKLWWPPQAVKALVVKGSALAAWGSLDSFLSPCPFALSHAL